jgi:hypothetical protein
MVKQGRSYSEREVELQRQDMELHNLLEKAWQHIDPDQKELRHEIMQVLIKSGVQWDGIRI